MKNYLKIIVAVSALAFFAGCDLDFGGHGKSIRENPAEEKSKESNNPGPVMPVHPENTSISAI